MDDAKTDRIVIAQKPTTEIVLRGRSLVQSVFAYEPRPIKRPRVDDDFGNMSVVVSTLEAFRYVGFLLEYTLSPNGWLRAWLVLWSRLFLLVAVPTVALTVVATIAVPLAANVANIAVYAEIAMRSACMALGWLVLCAAIIATVIAVVAKLTRTRGKRRHR